MHGDMGPVGAMTSLGWRKSRKFRDASQAVERPVSAEPDYGGCSAILQSRFVLSGTGQRQSRSASASGTRDVPDRSWLRHAARTSRRGRLSGRFALVRSERQKLAHSGTAPPSPALWRQEVPGTEAARGQGGVPPASDCRLSERAGEAPPTASGPTSTTAPLAHDHAARRGQAPLVAPSHGASTVLAVPDTTAARPRRSGAQAMAVRATRCGWDTP